MSAPRKLGLVLAGGGAKGAYAAGAVQYLAERGFRPDVIAGTSIGALNGAALAAAPSFAAGATRLGQMWDEIGRREILRPSASPLRAAASYAALAMTPTFARWARAVAGGLGLPSAAAFDPAPIEEMLREVVEPAALRAGTPLWATVCRVFGLPFIEPGVLETIATADADWVHVNSIEDDTQVHEVLLASAAVPLAFPKRQLGGMHYVDGGLRDNVPLGALREVGCTHAVVIHLGNGITWDRSRFPDVTIIEIRPRDAIQESEVPVLGWVEALLDFSPERIAELKGRGYADAKSIVEEIGAAFSAVDSARTAHVRMVDSTRDLMADGPLPRLGSRCE